MRKRSYPWPFDYDTRERAEEIARMLTVDVLLEKAWKRRR
jgi:hypothetical protein